MAAKQLPPIDLLRQLFRYDSETGNLYYLPRTPDKFEDGIQQSRQIKCNVFNKRHANRLAGSLRDKHTYVSLNHQSYAAHRIAYALHHSEQLPTELEIDHYNRDGYDNKIENLRKATSSQNNFNRKFRSTNKSGYVGVSKRCKKWEARITVNYKSIYLGSFKTIEEAIAARKRAEKEYFPEFERYQ